MFELTVHFNIEKIGKKVWIKWNFDLTVFELAVSNLYNQSPCSFNGWLLPLTNVLNELNTIQTSSSNQSKWAVMNSLWLVI